jgi:hypothetical protein
VPKSTIVQQDNVYWVYHLLNQINKSINKSLKQDFLNTIIVLNNYLQKIRFLKFYFDLFIYNALASILSFKNVKYT